MDAERALVKTVVCVLRKIERAGARDDELVRDRPVDQDDRGNDFEVDEAPKVDARAEMTKEKAAMSV